MAGGNAISSLRGFIGTDLAAERFSCILKVPDIYVYSVSCNLYDTYVLCYCKQGTGLEVFPPIGCSIKGELGVMTRTGV